MESIADRDSQISRLAKGKGEEVLEDRTGAPNVSYIQARSKREPDCTVFVIFRHQALPRTTTTRKDLETHTPTTTTTIQNNTTLSEEYPMSNPETVGENGADETAAITNGGTVVADDMKMAATTSNNTLPIPLEASNGHCNVKEATSSTPIVNSSNGDSKTGIVNPDGEDDEDNVEEVVAAEEDEEENLLMSLEEKAEQEADHEIHQPNAVEEAPRLLQAALKEGQVKADESEEEEDETVAHAAAAASPEVHVHKRVRPRMSLAFSLRIYFSHRVAE